MSEQREEYELGEDVTALAQRKGANQTGSKGTTRDLFDLTGRVALITGGAGHIGGAIAEALAKRGCRIMVLDTKSPRTADWWINQDISAPTLIEHVLEVIGVFGRLDILVNCAALLDAPGLDVPFAEQTLETWNRSLAVNLTAPWLLAQACAPMLAASGHGSIINVASIYGVVAPDPKLYEGLGMGCGMAYAVSKAGLLHLTKCLAAELAPKGVRANALVPGGVARGQDAAFVDRYCARVPLGRMATEQDLVGAALFLASDASAYVTGAVLPVEGGWTAW